MSAMLEVRGLGAGYGAQPVLSGVSLDVGARALVVLVGANGAGKSMLLGAIAGLVPCTGTVRLDGADGPFRYDMNFVLRSANLLGHAATAWSPKSGVTLEAWTTEPGLQFYDSAKLNPPVPGLGGVKYGPFGGFCLEAQRFPDAMNKPHFPSCILRPGEVYRQTTEYRFGRG